MEILDEYHKVKTKESGSHQIEIDMIKKVRKQMKEEDKIHAEEER